MPMVPPTSIPKSNQTNAVLIPEKWMRITKFKSTAHLITNPIEQRTNPIGALLYFRKPINSGRCMANKTF